MNFSLNKYARVIPQMPLYVKFDVTVINLQI